MSNEKVKRYTFVVTEDDLVKEIQSAHGDYVRLSDYQPLHDRIKELESKIQHARTELIEKHGFSENGILCKILTV